MPTMLTDFVPADIDASKWENVEPLFEDLRSRQVSTPEEFERWLIDRSELTAACSEGGARLYINMTCNTGDDAIEQAYLAFVRDVQPRLSPASFELDKRQAELHARFPLDAQRYAVLERNTRAEVDLFRPENVPLATQLEELGQRYQKITGSMTVTFDGEEKTLPQMGGYLESTDRSVREKAWRVIADRRLQDRDEIDDVYEKQIRLRHEVATNAGCADYVEWAFRDKKRFDYTREHCRAFHDAIERCIMPVLGELDEKRRRNLGLDALMPWDVSVDPLGREPLRPFSGGADLVDRTRKVFDRLDPQLAEMFRSLGDGKNTSGIARGELLDLDSRKGKAPGGYQYMQDRSRRPFIFMNAAGLHRDIETMIHEAGHAFHSMLCTDEPLVDYRHSPIEFAEVASMSMELLTMPYWDAFYADPAEADRARRQQLESSIGLLPWIATIDAFQIWIYENPEHTRQDRYDEWLRLEDRFGHRGNRVSWAGIEEHRGGWWQRQSHLFGVPLYYVEYGIAQLGALQLYLKGLEEGEAAAVTAYKTALSLGGSRPLPELFSAAGLEFRFDESMVSRIAERVSQELAKLPE